jgi:glycosyltransferase involved in cell wall biosynthesis
VIVGTYGARSWMELAAARAIPSAAAARPTQLIAVHDTLGNASSVRNAGARAASSNWLCFLDADDELDPDYLREMEKLAAHTSLLLAPYVSYVSDGRRAAPQIPNAGQWPHSNDAVCGTLISRELFEALGGWRQEFWPWNDWELWLRAVNHGAIKLHVPKAVYYAHRRPNSENSRLQRNVALKLHSKVKALYPEVFA